MEALAAAGGDGPDLLLHLLLQPERSADEPAGRVQAHTRQPPPQLLLLQPGDQPELAASHVIRMLTSDWLAGVPRAPRVGDLHGHHCRHRDMSQANLI